MDINNNVQKKVGIALIVGFGGAIVLAVFLAIIATTFNAVSGPSQEDIEMTEGAISLSLYDKDTVEFNKDTNNFEIDMRENESVKEINYMTTTEDYYLWDTVLEIFHGYSDTVTETMDSDKYGVALLNPNNSDNVLLEIRDHEVEYDVSQDH
ncbi:MAG TPA: hypothetical protein VK108_02250 [Pseudogracilibacillus sp.]|nr:hypothetical protein [Pseudogracilibacillus sp.]